MHSTASAQIKFDKGVRCEIKIKITKLLISGAAATGKSSLIAMLLGKDPVREHDSTLLSRPVRNARFTAEGDSNREWECLDDPADLRKHLASWIKNMATKDQFEQSRQQESSAEAKHEDMPEASSRLHTSETNVEATYKKTETHASLLSLIDDVAELNVETVHWIYTIDSGGQPAFQDVLPAFIRGNSVAIHTLKLNECLGDPVKMAFSVDGNSISPSKELCMTNFQLIETLVRSSSTHRLVDSNNTLTKPRCIILGTFHDKINECTETIEEKDRQLGNIHHIKDVLIKPGGTEKVIFPVNTTIEGVERKEVASRLRKKITETHGRSIEAKIKIEWFVFELHLRSLVEKMNQQGIVSMQECKRIGREDLGMKDEDVQKCIEHLHDQTLLLYFKDVLDNTIFLNPRSILDKVSAILFVSFLDDNTSLSIIEDIIDQLPSRSSENLRIRGRFDMEFLKCLPVLSKSFNLHTSFIDIFTADDLLKLLKHLFVIAELPDKGQYFIPCVLPTEPLEYQEKKDFSNDANELCFRWEKMPIPLGLFPALVVQLMQRENGQEFTLSEKQQLRNAIYLDCPPMGGAILLVDSIDWIEVYYSGENSKCSQIRRTIVDGISSVVNTFGYQDELRRPRQGFYCQVDKECCNCTRKHLCFVPTDQDRPTVVTCSKTSQVKNCSPQQIYWFDSVHTSTGTYTVINACHCYTLNVKPGRHGFPVPFCNIN